MEKLLSIVWYKVLPSLFGGQKGIAGFNEQLAKKYPLACLCSRNNIPSGPLSYKLIPELPVSKRQFIDPFCWNKIRSVAATEQATQLILEHPYHGMAAYYAKKATGAETVIHTHNIEYQRFKSLGKSWWRILFAYEKWVHRKADLVLFKTGSDKEYAIRHFGIAAGKCRVVPYGIANAPVPVRLAAGELIRQRHAINTSEKILLFAGTLDYGPNAKAVENIYYRIAPLLTAENFGYRIIICGRNKYRRYQYLQQLTHPSVIEAGEVEDIENYFAGADLFLNPVELGGGIQTKNIDALAHHCPVVCFDNMVEKETAATASTKIFTAPPGDWQAFTQQVKQAVVATGPTPASFFEFYRWENIVARLGKDLESN